MKDVARMAGVSTSTVSHVINGTRFVSQETKDRILRVIEQMNYRPNFLAQGLKRQTSKTIGLIISDLRDAFFYRFVNRLGTALHADEYDVLVCNSEGSVDKEVRHIEMLLRRGIDGLVYAPVDFRTCHPQLTRCSVPFVQIERKNANYAADYIGIDDEHEAARITEFLIEHGCRRIVFLMFGGPNYLGHRLLGFEKTARKHGVYDEELVKKLSVESQAGIGEFGDWLDSRSPIDAVICTNLERCQWLLEALKTRGPQFRHPHVFSFDDAPWFSLVPWAISALDQPIEQLAGTTVEVLLNRMRGDDSPPQDIRLPCRLIDRFTDPSPELKSPRDMERRPRPVV